VASGHVHAGELRLSTCKPSECHCIWRPCPSPARTGELQQQALTRLALQTLGSFDFGPARLLEFCRHHVVSYLDESDVATRRAAALAAAQVCTVLAPC